jgi:hypothetical protein
MTRSSAVVADHAGLENDTDGRESFSDSKCIRRDPLCAPSVC